MTRTTTVFFLERRQREMATGSRNDLDLDSSTTHSSRVGSGQNGSNESTPQEPTDTAHPLLRVVRQRGCVFAHSDICSLFGFNLSTHSRQNRPVLRRENKGRCGAMQSMTTAMNGFGSGRVRSVPKNTEPRGSRNKWVEPSLLSGSRGAAEDPNRPVW